MYFIENNLTYLITHVCYSQWNIDHRPAFPTHSVLGLLSSSIQLLFILLISVSISQRIVFFGLPLLL